MTQQLKYHAHTEGYIYIPNTIVMKASPAPPNKIVMPMCR